MANLIKRALSKAFGKECCHPHHIQTKDDILAIEPPYYSLELNARYYIFRYAFISAKRENSDAPWHVHTQSYTREYNYHTDKSRDSDFEYADVIICETDDELLKLFKDFDLARRKEGYKAHMQTDSSLTNGLTLCQAVKLFDLPKKQARSFCWRY